MEPVLAEAMGARWGLQGECRISCRRPCSRGYYPIVEDYL